MQTRFLRQVAPFVAVIAAAITGIAASAPPAGDDDRRPRGGAVVVANRAGGSISVIDPRSDTIVGTYGLPPGDRTPEPMYVVDAGRRRFLVGDRANDRVVVFDSRTFMPLGTIPAGAGVFHMWAGGDRLWVNNDVDRTGSVYDLGTLSLLGTVPMPADLVAAGGRPHDVVLDRHHGRYAYVSVIGVTGPSDYVVKFDTRTFAEVGRAPAGKDPHVSIDERGEQLFVPAQGSSTVFVLDAHSLGVLATLPVPGAHGAAMTRDGRRFYTTNLPGGGPDALFTIDARSLAVIGDPVDAPFPVPHNIALVRRAGKLYVTHSGATADQVSVYRLGHDGRPRLHTTVQVGLNPFGIAFVK